MKQNISIIIPTYNRGYIIGGALESALAQTYRDCEIVVIDDGSQDNTADIVTTFHSDRIRYIRHEQNRGYSAACNSGISSATGDLVAFLDSDDVWMPDKLERQVDFLTRHPEVDAVFTDVSIHTESEIIPSLTHLLKCFSRILESKAKAEEYVLSGREIYLCLLEEVPIKPTTFLSKRDIYERAGMFNEAWPSGTDWDLFLRFSQSCCFGYIDRPLAVQRRTPDATHQIFREEDKLFLVKTFLQERQKIVNDPDALAAVNRGIASHYRSLGGDYLSARKLRKSIVTYLEGFKETGETMMLLRAVSVFMPLILRDTLNAARNGLLASRNARHADAARKFSLLPHRNT